MAEEAVWTGRRAATRSGVLFFVLAAFSTLVGMADPFGHFAKEAKDPQPQQSELSASQPPARSIPVEPLGFFAPGSYYQGRRESLASLDFLDEDHLLFTFRAPGLIKREGNPRVTGEHHVRAVVVALQTGAMTGEALWTVHDRGRYIWMLGDGQFLFRDQSDLKLGDSSLELTPLIRFPGSLLWVETDPLQSLLVTESQERVDARGKAGDAQGGGLESELADTSPTIMLRVLRRSPQQVMLQSRIRDTVHLPINSEGYVEILRGKGHEWILNLNSFKGGSRIVGNIDSMCMPMVEFVSDPEFVVTTCNPDNSRWIVAMSTDGKRLWNASKPATQVWPRLIMAPNGLRLARETLVSTHGVNATSPISFEDIKGQLVEVYDATTGKIELTAPASPVLDGGGNIAFSPSSRRVAILEGGAIQVYELPGPAPAPQSAH
jgi:hypothetical protein